MINITETSKIYYNKRLEKEDTDIVIDEHGWKHFHKIFYLIKIKITFDVEKTGLYFRKWPNLMFYFNSASLVDIIASI